MRILVAEDDHALGVFLQKGLKIQGHQVDWVGDGDAALEHAAAHHPDLMILDLSLPGRDGMEVLAEHSERFAETSVLVLTGRNDLQERVRCLELGADDFILKPFSFQELTARCKAILRRKNRFAPPVLRCAGVQMNRLDRSVLCDGVAIVLTAKEFVLLEYLLTRSNECCTRADLLQHLWHMPPDSVTNVVDVYVNYLRRKLAAAQQCGSTYEAVIETVRGKGYRLRSVSARKPIASVRALDVVQLARTA